MTWIAGSGLRRRRRSYGERPESGAQGEDTRTEDAGELPGAPTLHGVPELVALGLEWRSTGLGGVSDLQLLFLAPERALQTDLDVHTCAEAYHSLMLRVKLEELGIADSADNNGAWCAWAHRQLSPWLARNRRSSLIAALRDDGAQALGHGAASRAVSR